MPLVSVIIPIYNTEKFLPLCINSVLNQTLTDIEVLLVNDGSTDGSGKICDEYACKDQRIQVIHSEPRSQPCTKPRTGNRKRRIYSFHG